MKATTSNGDGAFVLTNLPVDPYRLTAWRDGFENKVQGNFSLAANETRDVALELHVGQEKDLGAGW